MMTIATHSGIEAETRCLRVTRRASAGSEAMLVERLRAGDDAAYEMLVRRYGGRMLATARRMLGSEPDARDAVQDALLSAFRSIERFEGGAQLSTWLHRIVVNAALMRLRSRRRRREDAIDDLLPHFDEEGWWPEGGTREAVATGEALERDEVRARVRRAIAQLPETYRTILTLRDIEDLDPAEAARALGIGTNAVKSRLHRARQALKTLLERDGVLAPAHSPSAQTAAGRAGGDAGRDVAAA
jgi:RNA polymerase sigma-70 factor (ECF subfamily)